MEADVATASVRSSLKAVSGEQLAARHCFLLEDPPDDKKSSNSDRFVNRLISINYQIMSEY